MKLVSRTFRGVLLVGALLACACGSDEDEAADAAVVPDAAVAADAAEQVERCALESALVTGQGLNFEIFMYEASHPEASVAEPWPGGPDADAPDAEPCSTAGVMPWHSITHADALAACESIGWRLCTGEEMQRACEGPTGTAYTWGNTFEGGKCNFREGYLAEGMETASAAPAGHFEECVSAEGVYDLSGNLWEWTSDRDESDRAVRFYQGAGWRTIAERHRDHNLVCAERNKLLRIQASSFANQDVGFRCCRNAQ